MGEGGCGGTGKSLAVAGPLGNNQGLGWWPVPADLHATPGVRCGSPSSEAFLQVLPQMDAWHSHDLPMSGSQRRLSGGGLACTETTSVLLGVELLQPSTAAAAAALALLVYNSLSVAWAARRALGSTQDVEPAVCAVGASRCVKEARLIERVAGGVRAASAAAAPLIAAAVALVARRLSGADY